MAPLGYSATGEQVPSTTPAKVEIPKRIPFTAVQ